MCRIILVVILSGIILGSSTVITKNSRAADSSTANSIDFALVNVQAPKTLCDRNEQVVFNCSMQKSAKLLSICTSKQIDSKNGYVQYRFGMPGKVELEFPAERNGSQSSFAYSRYTRPLVTLLLLKFESAGYKYELHQDSNAEEKPAINVSSLTITPPDPNPKAIEMTCREPVKGSLMLLEDVVPRSEESSRLAP